MSTQDAIAAASTNPQLSVFVAAVRTAGLDKLLTTRHAYTLIIPANSAFASLSKTDIIRLKNSGELMKIVKYHAVSTSITPQQFAGGATVTTLEGGRLTLAKSGTAYKVGPASVLCGNIRTANATVYIVSKVLLPPS
ncbi:MAG TPA: fasciclin domain-containing protein [Streptosporangiaceae bacterium]